MIDNRNNGIVKTILIVDLIEGLYVRYGIHVTRPFPLE